MYTTSPGRRSGLGISKVLTTWELETYSLQGNSHTLLQGVLEGIALRPCTHVQDGIFSKEMAISRKYLMRASTERSNTVIHVEKVYSVGYCDEGCN